MSSLMDKIRTLIQARMRGPHSTRKTPPLPEGAPSAPRAIPEVTRGRPRRPRAEVSEAAPAAHQAAAPRPATFQPSTLPPPGSLDESRVADMLKESRKDS